ncbi:MAG: glutathione S-transferase family protein [Nitrosomonas sp.]
MSDQSNVERTLYGFWLSPYMCQVAHVLSEAGLAYQYERVSPFQGSTLTPEHIERNPLGKIPTLRDVNGIDISESHAICRYLARIYSEARKFYPIDDPMLCAQVDAKNDFITFSIAGPFFNWFVVSGYFPKAWKLKIEKEAHIYNLFSVLLSKMWLSRLVNGSRMEPFLLGKEPFLPDFQLFYTLELSQMFSELFEIPEMHLFRDDPALQTFYDAMCERPSTQKILAAKELELDVTKKELYGGFGAAYLDKHIDRRLLGGLFGREV